MACELMYSRAVLKYKTLYMKFIDKVLAPTRSWSMSFKDSFLLSVLILSNILFGLFLKFFRWKSHIGEIFSLSSESSKVYFLVYNNNYLLWDTFILPIILLINSNHFNYCSLVSCYVPCEAWYGFTETFFSSQLQTRTNSSRAG